LSCLIRVVLSLDRYLQYFLWILHIGTQVFRFLFPYIPRLR
jgi:hypothetical protein